MPRDMLQTVRTK